MNVFQNMPKPTETTKPTAVSTTATAAGAPSLMDNKPTMWDAFGQSLDINLDNLTPFSKGAKNNQNSNIPMNQMMSPTQASKPGASSGPVPAHFNFSSPPTSPNRTTSGLASPGAKPSQTTTSASNNLLDF